MKGCLLIISKREFKVSYQEKGLTYEEALRAKRVLRKDKVSLASLLFLKEPQSIKPAFTIKAISFLGMILLVVHIVINRRILKELFRNCLNKA